MINLKEALARGEVLAGPFSIFGSASMVETIGYAGFDFVVIDTEHTATSPYGGDLENLVRAARAADIAPVVRVAWNDRAQILKALDMGASAVVVPHVNTAAEAAAAVSAAHYAPIGRRSATPVTMGSRRGFVDWPTHYRHGLDDALVLALIEEHAGVESIEEIAAVPGLGGIFFGPFDLAVSMGHADSAFEADVSAERQRVYGAAKKHGLPIADLAWDVSSALDMIRLGAQLLAIGTDGSLFANACRSLSADLTAMKQELAASRSSRRAKPRRRTRA